MANQPDPKKVKADAKGRVTLGVESAGREFVVRETRTGFEMIAVKTVTVPESEAWLWQNPEALSMVMEGIAESKAGTGRPLGSLAEFANIDPDS